MNKTLAAVLAFSLVAPAIAFAQAAPATPATPARPHAQAPAPAATPAKKEEAKKNEVRRDATQGQTQQRN